MKKALFVALIIALIVVSLTGCGGGSDNQTATETPAGSAATQTPPTTPTTPATTTASTTSAKPELPRKPDYSGNLPKDFQDSVDNSWVSVVAFYDPKDIVSNKVQDIVEDLVQSPNYKDQINYLSYDISGKASASVAKLTTVLGAQYLPHVTIIDKEGNIVFEESGFTESAHLSNALYKEVYKDKD